MEQFPLNTELEKQNAIIFLMMYGETNIQKMAALKKTLDPNLILGIGNIFDEKYLS